MLTRAWFSLNRNRDWFIPIVGLLLIWILAARSPVDTDIWWHLRAGKQMAVSGQPVLVDLFSSTRFGQPWMNHSWLSEVFLYYLYSAFGYTGLELWVVVAAVGSMAFIYAQLSGPPIGRVFVLISGSTVAALVWSPRPQLVSLVFFAVVGYLLFQYKYRKVNWLWVLPVLFLFWGNLHGGYLLGLLLAGCMVAGEILNHLMRNDRAERLGWLEIRNLVGWLGVSSLALLVNPNGLDIWRVPFQTVGVSSLQNFVQEWASPNFHDLYNQPYLWLLFAAVAGIGLAGRRVDGTDLIGLVLFGYLGFVAQRNFGPFALAAMPVLSRGLVQAYKTWKGGEEMGQPVELPQVQTSPRPRWQRRVNLLVVGLLALVAFGKLGVTSNPVLMDGLINSGNPVGAVAWLKGHQSEGHLLNEYNWGGYLTWALPEYPVFLDGRTDLFGDELIGQWMTVMQAGEGWRAVVDRWDITLIMADPTRPILPVLQQEGWELLYQDSISVLYRRP
jgi:hypothetical protein